MTTPSRASSLPQWICAYRTNVGASLLAMAIVPVLQVIQDGGRAEVGRLS
ncbi:hypothetical protein EMIT0P253_30091 [Pseudomonas sp. IT-P253]